MMRTKLIIAAPLLLLAAACGKAPEPGSAANSASAANTNAASAPANAPNIPPEFQTVTNAMPSSNMPINQAAQPPTKGEPRPKTIEFPGKDGPAPDDSDVKTALGENLVQIRTFHSNPQIAKVEKTTILAGGTSRSIVKVYLKNGQVKQVDLKDPFNASAADILKSIH